MFPMPDEYEGLTDEERRRFLEQYAPSPTHTGAMARGAQGFSPLPAPRGALMPDREALTPAPSAGGGDDLMARFMAAQQKGAGNASFAGLGGRLDNYARVFAGVPEREVDTTSMRQRPVADLMAQEGLKQQERQRTRQTELDAVNLDKTRAETTKAQASARATEADEKREAALADPKSPESAALRATATELLKGRVTPETLASMSGVAIRDALKYGTSQMNAEAMAGFRQTQLDMTAEQQGFQRQLDKWRLGLEQERLAQQWDISQLTLEQQRELAELRAKADITKAETEAGIAAGNKVAADTKDIAEAFDKAGGPNFYAKYDEVSSLLGRYKDDIPGFGKVDGLKPDMFVSDEALAMRQGIGQMLAEYRKGITGAGMSNAERTEYGTITGLLQSNNERSVRQGVERLRRGMDARFQALGGGFRPEAVETYAKRVPAFGAALRGSPVAPPQAPPRVGTADNPAPSTSSGNAGGAPKPATGDKVTLHWSTGGTTEVPAARAQKLAKEQPERFSLSPFPPEKVRKKQYSKVRNQTRTVDGNGKVISVEEGDTSGK